MKISRKEGIASLLVLAVVVPYIGYVVRGSMPFIQDPRGMAATGLILGGIAFAIVGRKAFGTGALLYAAAIVGASTLGLGVAALWMESELLLGIFIVGVVTMWALELLHHVGEGREERASSLT